MSFQQGAALTVERDTALEARFPRVKVIPVEIGNRIDGDTSILDERGEEVWKEVLHHRRPPLQQYVNMASLWHSFARLYLLWKVIALDYRYLLEMIRKNAARQ